MDQDSEFTRRALIGGFSALGAGLVVAQLPSSPASAQSAGTTSGSPALAQAPGIAMAAPVRTPGLTYQTINGSAFQPRRSDFQYTTTGSGGGQTNTSAGVFMVTASRLEIPHGAVIKELVFYVLKNSSSGHFVALSSFDPSTDGLIDHALNNVVPNNASTQTVSLTSSLGSGVVVNSDRSYALQVQQSAIDGTQALYGARVGYIEPNTAQRLVLLPSVLRLVNTIAGTGITAGPIPLNGSRVTSALPLPVPALALLATVTVFPAGGGGGGTFATGGYAGISGTYSAAATVTWSAGQTPVTGLLTSTLFNNTVTIASFGSAADFVIDVIGYYV